MEFPEALRFLLVPFLIDASIGLWLRDGNVNGCSIPTLQVRKLGPRKVK